MTEILSLGEEISLSPAIVLHEFMLNQCKKAYDVMRFDRVRSMPFEVDNLKRDIQEVIAIKQRWICGSSTRVEVLKGLRLGKEVYRSVQYDCHGKDRLSNNNLWYLSIAVKEICTTSMSRRRIEEVSRLVCDSSAYCVFGHTTREDHIIKELRQSQAQELQTLRLEHEAKKQQELESVASNFSATLMEGMFQ